MIKFVVVMTVVVLFFHGVYAQGTARDERATKDYVDQSCQRIEQEIKGLMQFITERFRGMDEALGIKTKDMEKEYDHLNNLRGEVTTDRNLLASKSSVENLQKQVDEWKENMQTQHQDLVNRVTVIGTRFEVWTAAITVIFVLFQFAMSYFRRGRSDSKKG